jgi:hypothetical protein
MERTRALARHSVEPQLRWLGAAVSEPWTELYRGAARAAQAAVPNALPAAEPDSRSRYRDAAEARACAIPEDPWRALEVVEPLPLCAQRGSVEEAASSDSVCPGSVRLCPFSESSLRRRPCPASSELNMLGLQACAAKNPESAAAHNASLPS